MVGSGTSESKALCLCPACSGILGSTEPPKILLAASLGLPCAAGMIVFITLNYFSSLLCSPYANHCVKVTQERGLIYKLRAGRAGPEPSTHGEPARACGGRLQNAPLSTSFPLVVHDLLRTTLRETVTL